MIILLVIGLVLMGFAGTILVRAIWWSSGSSAGLLRRIDNYGFERAAGDDDERSVRERLDDVATRVGDMVGSRSGSRGRDQIARDLVAAGIHGVSAGTVIGYRALSTAALPLLWIWFAATAGMKPPLAVIGALLITALGWLMPTRLLQQRARQRLGAIDDELPELIDLLVVTVEAGLGFVGSMQMAATRVRGAIGEELRLTLQEQSMGLSIQEALMNMARRVDTPYVRSFARSVVQGETLGVSMGQIMRDLANEMRRRRRAVAQERAQKAPIKILFPLVLLIFPAMFVVLLGPALLLMLRAFGGG